MYAATLSALFYAVGLLVLIALASLVAIIQPYRQELAVYNTADVILILMMAAWYGSILCCNMTYEIAPTHLKIYFCIDIHHGTSTTCVYYIHCLAMAVQMKEGTTETLSVVSNMEAE